MVDCAAERLGFDDRTDCHHPPEDARYACRIPPAGLRRTEAVDDVSRGTRPWELPWDAFLQPRDSVERSRSCLQRRRLLRPPATPPPGANRSRPRKPLGWSAPWSAAPIASGPDTGWPGFI